MESSRLQIPMYSLIESLWSMYKETKVGGHPPITPDVRTGPPTAYPADHLAAHELLEYILVNGEKDRIDWITGNLKTFAELIRLESGKTGRRKAS